MQPVRPPNSATVRRRRDDTQGSARPPEAPAEAPVAATPPQADVAPTGRPGRRLASPAAVPERESARAGEEARPSPANEGSDERRRADRGSDERRRERRNERVEENVVERPLPVRGTTDFSELAGIADLSPAEVKAALDQYSRRAPSARLRRGQRVNGTITRLTASTVFVDVGTKADAILERNEVEGDPQVGDVIEVFVSSSPMDGEVRLTKTPSGEAAIDMLDEAKLHRSILMGKVTGHREAGYDVLLAGGIKGFCPAALIDVGPITDPESYVGRNLGFRILEVKGKEALVNHRSVAEELAVEESRRQLETIREGEVYEGVVTRLKEFGAFVRLSNGVEGLVHLSNISKTRIQKPEEVLKEGQEVRVKVLQVEAAARRLSLGIKQAEHSTNAIADTRGVDMRPKAQPEQRFGLMAGLLADWKPTPKKAEPATRVVRKK